MTTPKEHHFSTPLKRPSRNSKREAEFHPSVTREYLREKRGKNQPSKTTLPNRTKLKLSPFKRVSLGRSGNRKIKRTERRMITAFV